MNRIKVWVEPKAVIEIMQSEKMQEILNEYAQKAVAELGEGYEATSFMGTDRAKAQVTAVSYKAKKENLEQNTILKAVQK